MTDDFAFNKKENGYLLTFSNLYLKYGFKGAEDSTYMAKVYTRKSSGKRDDFVGTYTSSTEEIKIPLNLSNDGNGHEVLLRTQGKCKKWKRKISVYIDKNRKIVGIRRQE